MKQYKVFLKSCAWVLFALHTGPLWSAGPGVPEPDISGVIKTYLDSSANRADDHRAVLAHQTISDTVTLALVRNHTATGRYTDRILVLTHDGEGEYQVTGDVDKREFCFDQDLSICGRTE